MTEITGKLSAALADRYRIEGRFDKGGMATVYLAEDLKHHRKGRGQVLRPELAAVERVVERRPSPRFVKGSGGTIVPPSFRATEPFVQGFRWRWHGDLVARCENILGKPLCSNALSKAAMD